MAQKERKKDLEKYFLAHIQTPVNFFDLVSLCPGDLKWTIDTTPLFLYPELRRPIADAVSRGDCTPLG